MFQYIDIDRLDDKSENVVKAYGHLAGALKEASLAEGYLSDGLKDEAKAIHDAWLTIRLVRDSLSRRVERIAKRFGAETGYDVSFVDGTICAKIVVE